MPSDIPSPLFRKVSPLNKSFLPRGNQILILRGPFFRSDLKFKLCNLPWKCINFLNPYRASHNCSRRHFYFIFYFSEKTSLGISCKLSAWQTIHMKCQDWIPWKKIECRLQQILLGALRVKCVAWFVLHCLIWKVPCILIASSYYAISWSDRRVISTHCVYQANISWGGWALFDFPHHMIVMFSCPSVRLSVHPSALSFRSLTWIVLDEFYSTFVNSFIWGWWMVWKSPITFERVTALAFRQKSIHSLLWKHIDWFGRNLIYQMILTIFCFGVLLSIFQHFSKELLPLVTDKMVFALYLETELMVLDENSYIKWAASSNTVASSRRKMCGFTSSYVFARSHPDLCSASIQFIESDDSDSTLVWAFAVRACPEDLFLLCVVQMKLAISCWWLLPSIFRQLSTVTVPA